MGNIDTTIEHFISEYGYPALCDLIRSLKEGESCASISRRLGVTRERVRQWKVIFGTTITVYHPHREIEAMIDGKAAK